MLGLLGLTASVTHAYSGVVRLTRHSTSLKLCEYCIRRMFLGSRGELGLGRQNNPANVSPVFTQLASPGLSSQPLQTGQAGTGYAVDVVLHPELVRWLVWLEDPLQRERGECPGFHDTMKGGARRVGDEII